MVLLKSWANAMTIIRLYYTVVFDWRVNRSILFLFNLVENKEGLRDWWGNGESLSPEEEMNGRNGWYKGDENWEVMWEREDAKKLKLYFNIWKIKI